MSFGDKWRGHKADYWDAMAERCVDLPINDALSAEALRYGSIIEIGCGAGHLAQIFRDAGYTGGYWGCDISGAAVGVARSRLDPGRHAFEVGQFERLSEEGLVPDVEMAVARSVIQHQAHWLPLAEAALRHAPIVVFGIIRSTFFKPSGEHEVRPRGGFYDVCISLEAMRREATAANINCSFRHMEGRRGPEVMISMWRS